MLKRVIAHNEMGGLSLPVNILKADWASKTYVENNRTYLLAGHLLQVKNAGDDIRLKGVEVIPFAGTGQADAVLLNDVELIWNKDNATGTALVNGIVYLDKLQEVEATVTKAMLPLKIDYTSKSRV